MAFGTNVIGSSAVITNTSETTGTVAWLVPFDATVETLAPTYTLSPDAACDQPNDGITPPTPAFSTTIPVEYVVTASGGSPVRTYTVTVTVAPTPPGGVNGLALWLDASAPETMTLSSGTVNEWRDKLGSAAKMTRDHGAPTVVASGIGSIPTVHFTSGSSMGDGVNHTPEVTILYVSRQTGGSNARVLSGGNNWLLGYWGGRRGSAYFDGDVLLNGNGASDTAPHLYAATIGGSGQNSTVWAEGTQLASNQGGTQGPNGLFVGGGGAYSEYSDCDISEVLVYNRILDATDLDAVGGYLAAKYGLTTSYPTDLNVRLTSPANSQAYPSGTSISATASVNSGTAPYTVEFFFDNVSQGTDTEAPYEFDLGILSEGSYEIYVTVTDSAEPQVTATSTTNTFTVAPPTATTTTLATSGTPTTYGDSVTFTATVDPVPTGGTVQFKNGVDPLGTPVAVNTGTGKATYSTTTLNVGTYEITAEYSGYQIYEPSTTAASISQVVDKAALTVTALNMLRLPNTANPEFLYEVTGFKNGETLGTSDVGGTPELTTTAADFSTEETDYPILCGVGGLTSTNYDFVTFVDGILTVADVADTFSVNFYSFGNLPPASQANVLMTPELPAGLGHWYTPGWFNQVVPWGGGLQPAVALTSNKGSSSTFLFKDCRNGWQSWGEPRTTNLGDGNYNMMGSGVNSTLDPIADPAKFDMEMTNIPFGTYDVIFYFRSNDAQYGDGTGVIVFNGGTERAYKMKSGAFDGNFIEMVDGGPPRATTSSSRA